MTHLPSIVEAATTSAFGTEVIVVDNGSSDGTAQTVLRTMPYVHVVVEETPGLAVARNTGVRATRAPVVLFTDDDVDVPRDWVDRMAAPLREGAAEVVVGGIRVHDSLRQPWMSPWLLQNFADYPDQKAVDPDVVGANFGALRTTLTELPFDERLGVPPYQRHEDAFFGVQVRDRGWRIVGVGGDPVVHHFDPSRLETPALRGLAAAAGRCSAYVWYHWAHGVAPHLRAKAVAFRLLRLAGLPWLRRHPSDRDLKLISAIAFVDELRRIAGTPRHYPDPSARSEKAREG
jgi:glycosyltransferase involved in cell wall biosynthesis